MKSFQRLMSTLGVLAVTIALGVVAGEASARNPSADAAAKPSATSASTLSAGLQTLTEPEIAAAPAGEQAEALSVAPRGPGSLLREGKRLVVNVRFATVRSGSTAALRDAGAEILLVSPEYEIVTVAAAIGDLRAISAVDGVISFLEEQTPMLARPGGTAPDEVR